MAFDLRVIETGNGGDIAQIGNDLVTTNTIASMIYLALFGGNPEESTKISGVKLESFDYWANTLLLSAEPSQQFNSLTENILNTTALNSQGRQTIENAVYSDINFLSELFIISVRVTLPDVDKVTIEISMKDKEKGKQGVIIINLKKSSTGDYSVLDFDATDFFI